MRSKVDGGSAISKPTLNWVALAHAQSQRLHQATTVTSIGAGEGFAMLDPNHTQQACCGDGWSIEYARRVRSMIADYRPDGHGRVIWLTVPLPRGNSQAITAAANRDRARAATGATGVTVIRIDELFTSNGYQEVIRYRGHDVDMREPDGVHLNAAGTAIARQDRRSRHQRCRSTRPRTRMSRSTARGRARDHLPVGSRWPTTRRLASSSVAKAPAPITCAACHRTFHRSPRSARARRKRSITPWRRR